MEDLISSFAGTRHFGGLACFFVHMEFAVKHFRVNARDSEGLIDTPAPRYLEKTVRHYVRQENFSSIVDATAKAREQLRKIGLVDKVDGSLKWTSQLHRRKCHFLNRFRTPLGIPPVLDCVELNADVVPKKRELTARATVNSLGGVGVEAKGFKSFFWEQPMIAEGSLTLTHLSPWRPEIDISLHRAILPGMPSTMSIVPLPDLRKLTFNFHRKENGGRLHYLASETRTGAEMRYEPDNSQVFKFGIDRYRSNKRASSYLQRIPDNGLMLGSHLYSSVSWLRRFSKCGKQWAHNYQTQMEVLTPITDNFDSERSMLKLGLASDLFLKRNRINMRFRSVINTCGFPVWPQSYDPPTIAQVPLSKRLFLGGPSTSLTQPSLRGFSSGRVGGMVIPPMPQSPTSLGSRTDTEHLGGVLQLGCSAEISLETLRVNTGPYLKEWPQLKEVAESAEPFTFIDIGTLTPTLAVDQLGQVTHISSGFGTKFRLPGNLSIELSAAQALKKNYVSPTQRFQINFTMEE